MSLTDGSLSAADIAAVTGSNGGFGNWGGDGAWWLIILFLFIFNGNWGNWGGGYGNGGTYSEVQRGFDQSAVMGGLSGIQSSLTNGFVDTAAALCNGFAGVFTDHVPDQGVIEVFGCNAQLEIGVLVMVDVFLERFVFIQIPIVVIVWLTQLEFFLCQSCGS